METLKLILTMACSIIGLCVLCEIYVSAYNDAMKKALEEYKKQRRSE